MRKGTDLPCVGERNHVVYVYVAGCRPCRTVVWAEPTTTCGGAGRTLYHICTIALQYHLSCITVPGLSDPMGEEGTTVAGLWALGGDLESRKLALGCSRRRYVGGCWRRSWKGERRGEYCAEYEIGLHCCEVGSRWLLTSDEGLGNGTFCQIMLKEV